ncbi:hypothetical protein [Luteibacter rhizovicinus]|uniref:hypothetical protein n=1 Tax=Luteibacter rhizovicinus TaxID=242606 RepID=UPI001404FF9B|nr:hypothetical protein [Luteibacter rhizovicinus]
MKHDGLLVDELRLPFGEMREDASGTDRRLQSGNVDVSSPDEATYQSVGRFDDLKTLSSPVSGLVDWRGGSLGGERGFNHGAAFPHQ